MLGTCERKCHRGFPVSLFGREEVIEVYVLITTGFDGISVFSNTLGYFQNPRSGFRSLHDIQHTVDQGCGLASDLFLRILAINTNSNGVHFCLGNLSLKTRLIR